MVGRAISACATATRPRAVLLNNWEATGFDFDFNRIAGLYDPAKEHRRRIVPARRRLVRQQISARQRSRRPWAIGSPTAMRLPDGLAPLAAEAVKRGLRFGIWMEPEMVNPKSELFDQHPDWVIRQPKRELELQRNQLVLDLTRPAVQEFEWNAIQDILSVPDITYAKWDCNRYLTQPGSSYLAPDRQSDLWIDYVHALYAFMDKTARPSPTPN